MYTLWDQCGLLYNTHLVKTKGTRVNYFSKEHAILFYQYGSDFAGWNKWGLEADHFKKPLSTGIAESLAGDRWCSSPQAAVLKLWLGGPGLWCRAPLIPCTAGSIARPSFPHVCSEETTLLTWLDSDPAVELLLTASASSPLGHKTTPGCAPLCNNILNNILTRTNICGQTISWLSALLIYVILCAFYVSWTEGNERVQMRMKGFKIWGVKKDRVHCEKERQKQVGVAGLGRRSRFPHLPSLLRCTIHFPNRVSEVKLLHY